jgi:hypothetical protein
VCALALLATLNLGAVVPRIPSEPFSVPGYIFLDPVPPQETSGETVFYWSQSQILKVRFFNPKSNAKPVRFSLEMHSTPCDGDKAAGAWLSTDSNKQWITFTESSASRVSWSRKIKPGFTQVLTIEGQAPGCVLPDGRTVYWWVGNITVG